jgi:hypothetical protein
MRNSKIFRMALTAALAFAVVLAGCGKKDSGGSGGSAGGGEADAAAALESAAATVENVAATVGSGGTANPASDFKYDLTKDGKGVVILEWLSKNGGNVVIPAEIEGYPVVAIGGYAFRELSSSDEYRYIESGYKRITGVVIPDSVTEIVETENVSAAGVFKECTELKNVTLSKNLKVIVDNMFSGCTSLASITIPESVETIEEFAFYGCAELTEVKLPSHPIKYTGYGGPGTANFLGCSKLNLATRKAIQDSGYTGSF